MRTLHRAATVGIAAVLAAGLLAGCSSNAETSAPSNKGGTSQAEGSRVKFYSSLSAMADDSTVIVSGTVTAQRTVTDIDPITKFTISTVTVSAAPKGAALSVGSTVEVRQFGSLKETGPAPLLVKGEGYLLYLTASGLDGELASQYYVTGGNAGLYAAPEGSSAAKGSGIAFTRMQLEKGDVLPTAVDVAGATG